MKDQIRNQEYFRNKNCDLCKKPATHYRYSDKLKKGQMLCSSKECEYKSLVTNGFITLIIKNEN